MRNELSSAFIAAMQSSFRKPIQLMVIYFSFGTVYLSDRDITVNNKLYKGLVEDWGKITTSGYGISDLLSETLELTVTLWNGGEQPFSNYFMFEEPTNVKVDLMQTFEGLLPSDMAKIGTFVIQEPIQYSEASRLISLDLVSENMRYTANVGKVLRKADWPDALEEDLNKGIDLIVGDAGTVKTLCAVTPKTCTMKGSILQLPTVVNTYEDLDELGFKQSGYIIIDDEILYYNSRDNDTFNVTRRSQAGTKVSDHSDGVTIQEYRTDHIFIIGEGPVSSVSDVRANGILVDPSEYTLSLNTNPAYIRFSKKPSYVEYTKGTRTEEIDFDAVSVTNNAYQAYYSYDVSKKADGALLDKNHTPLAIIQTDPPQFDGEIVRVLLSVDHWETKFYRNDRVDVWVEGIGVIGRLSRPNESDYVDVSGEVDIDHGHDHASGGNHDHNFNDPTLSTTNPSHVHSNTDPNFATADPLHLHNADILGDVITDSGSLGLPYQIIAPTNPTAISKETIYNYAGVTGVKSASVQVKLTVRNIKKVKVDVYDTRGWIIGTKTWEYGTPVNLQIDQLINANTVGYPLLKTIVTVYGPPWAVGAEVWVSALLATTNVSGGIYNASTGTYTYKTANGSVAYKNTNVTANIATSGVVKYEIADSNGVAIKSVDDVEELATQNVQLENIITNSSSKSIREVYDLTKYLDKVDWDWLTNRDVQLKYVGTSEDVQVIVTYMTFEVEYRQRQKQITNNITCKPVGSIENRPDAVIQYLLNKKAGVPLSIMGSIWAQPQTWNDAEIWQDSKVWLDGGEKLPAPSGAYFEEAASRFSYLGYRLDGVIAANQTVSQAVKNICFQTRSRLIWSAGMVKLSVREKVQNWVTLKTIGKEEIQFKSLQVEKSKTTDIYNDIDLFYKVNRISNAADEEKYDASLNRFDQKSINTHGQRKDNSKWLFDLVRSDSMATDLIDYYIWRYGEVITKYRVKAYLQQFDIEKDDTIRLTSAFQRINSLPLRISDISRDFGTAKINKMNMFEIIGESIRHIMHVVFANNSVIAKDAFVISGFDEEDVNDIAVMIDELSFILTAMVEDSIETSDEITMTADYNSAFNEVATITDEFISTLKVVFEDVVNVSDKVFASYYPCFGACGFGTLPFGAKTQESGVYIDETTIEDEILIYHDNSLKLESSVVVLDNVIASELIKDSVSFSEELIVSSCFGSPIENTVGFGLTLFGR